MRGRRAGRLRRHGAATRCKPRPKTRDRLDFLRQRSDDVDARRMHELARLLEADVDVAARDDVATGTPGGAWTSCGAVASSWLQRSTRLRTWRPLGPVEQPTARAARNAARTAASLDTSGCGAPARTATTMA